MSKLSGFEAVSPSLDDEVASILSTPGLLNKTQAQLLYNLIMGLDLIEFTQPDSIENFSLKEEMEAQVAACRALRANVIGTDGKVKQSASATQIKEVMQTSNTIMQTLMKFHDKIMGDDRQSAMERAVIRTLNDLSEDVKQDFITKLQDELEVIK